MSLLSGTDVLSVDGASAPHQLAHGDATSSCGTSRRHLRQQIRREKCAQRKFERSIRVIPPSAMAGITSDTAWC